MSESPETVGLDELMRLIYRLETPAELKKLFDSVIRHRTVGIYNAMLVHIQCPGARMVMSAAEWLALGRRLKPEARPLVILRAFGPVSFVFELNDTEGEPLPEDAQPFLLPRTLWPPPVPSPTTNSCATSSIAGTSESTWWNYLATFLSPVVW